jgi:hypothetical protein
MQVFPRTIRQKSTKTRNKKQSVRTVRRNPIIICTELMPTHFLWLDEVEKTSSQEKHFRVNT